MKISTPKRRNYNDVVVAPRDESPSVAVQEAAYDLYKHIEIEAAAPRDPKLFPVLLDEVMHRLIEAEGGPVDALLVAGQVVRSTPWVSYRAGRARLASAAASYLTWLAPPLPWTKAEVAEVDRRRPLGWRSPEGVLVIDVLTRGGRETASLARQILRSGQGAVAVRALDMSAPMQSRVLVPGCSPKLLAESAWSFGGRLQ